MTTKEMTIMASLTTVLVVQNLIFSYVQYIQLTFLLILLYARILGIKKTTVIIVIYMIVTNIILGAVLPLQFITMFIGFILGPVLINTVFKKTNNAIILSFLALFVSFFYIILLDFSWWLVFPSGFKGLILTLIQGIIFAIPMLISSFISVLILFKPLEKLFSEIYIENMK